MQILDKEMLTDRLENFWGFGQYESDFWFIGMEEGGGNEIDEVSKRLKSWKSLGSTELVDNYEYHLGIPGYDYERFFEGKIKLKMTWAKLIRVFLNNENPDNLYTAKELKAHQSKCWGRKNSNNCLIDIFPLPSPTANTWQYDKWTDLDILKSRELYKRTLKQKRIESLEARISTHQPQVVLFYGWSTDYMEIWEQVVGIKFTASYKYEMIEKKFIYCTQLGKMLFIVTYQPSFAWNNAYWDNVGRFIHERL